MIKKQVVLRNEIYTIYSSEQQERMKVYFDLSEKYKLCNEKCSTPECSQSCEQIFNDYADLLQDRYKEKEELINAEVKNLPMFTRKTRQDRSGWFYDITGKGWNEFWSK